MQQLTTPYVSASQALSSGQVIWEVSTRLPTSLWHRVPAKEQQPMQLSSRLGSFSSLRHDEADMLCLPLYLQEMGRLSVEGHLQSLFQIFIFMLTSMSTKKAKFEPHKNFLLYGMLQSKFSPSVIC